MKGLKGRIPKIKLIPTINSLIKGINFHAIHPQHPFFSQPFFNQNHHSPPDYTDQECKTNVNPLEPVIDSKDQKGKETDSDIDISHQHANKPTTTIVDQKGKGTDLDIVVGHQVANKHTPKIEDQKGKQTDLNTDFSHNNNNNNPTPKIEDQKGKETDLIIDVGHQNTNNPTPKIEIKEIVIKEDHPQPPVSSNTIIKNEAILEIEESEAEEYPSLNDFEEKCPPGGEDSVVLYTTSLRGIRKTFKDCSSIRYLLSTFNILIHERDVSMDMEFRDELWRLFSERVVPPKLFIKGRYIGGADEIIGLHEEGILKKLLKGIPLINIPCRECANMRFLVCPNCDGSHKIFAQTEDNDELCLRCPDCNENGLVKCSVCS